MLLELLSEIVRIDDVLLIVKSGGAVSEVRSNSLGIRQKDRWITIGSNDGPAHMHVDSDQVRYARFVREERPGRTSYSVRFFDADGTRVLAAFFTGMYDESKNINPQRKKKYDELDRRFGPEIKF